MTEINKSSSRAALLLTRSLLGTIALLGMLIGFDASRESIRQLTIALIVTNISLTLTRFHIEAITYQIQHGRRPNRKERWNILLDSSLVALPTLMPIAVLAARWLGLIPAGMGITIAKTAAIGMLFLIGYISSRLVGDKYLQSVLTGLGDMSLGLIIVSLKFWV
jgi:putative flippase GtrA